MSFDPNSNEYVIPTDASEAPPTLPEGRHGEHGEAEIVHCKFSVAKTKDGEEVPFLDILVAVQHPELGRCSVGTGAFGATNTSLKPRSRSKAEAFAIQLGLMPVPGKPISRDACDNLKGRRVIIDVSNRSYQGRVFADLCDIYLA